MKTYFFPIQSTSLAHYFATAIIKPAKYFDNKIADIQDKYKDFLLFTNKFGTTETDCCLEVILTDEEISELIDVNEGWFLFDEKPLPISRVKRIYFSDNEKKEITITNIRMSTAYIPDTLIGVQVFDNNPSEVIKIPSDCDGVNQEEKIEMFDRFLGALALMKTAGEHYMNYSPNYINTLSIFNSLIKEQISKIDQHIFKDSYKGLFTASNGFETVLPYLSKKIDEQLLVKIANENNQVVKKDKITHVIDVNSFNDTWTYTIAILNNYGVGDESRRKRIDGLIQSHFSEIKKGKAEGVALCYGYNRGYSAFAKDYGKDDKVSYKYKLESRLDYYTIESVYQYIFNNMVSSYFSYIDEWCPVFSECQPKKKSDYLILDEIIIGEKRAKTFSEEWWTKLYPKFNKEFGRLAQEIFRFFQEICSDIKDDIEDEQNELISQYENKLNECKKKIDDLTKQLKQKTEKNISQQHQLRDPAISVVENPKKDIKKENLRSLKVDELRELAKQRGLKVPSKTKKEELIKLLTNQQATTFDIPFETDNK